MEWVETTGSTVEAAKDAALDQLGVDEQDAEFEVLEEPKTGLFGRLRSEARVRARVRPATPRPKEDRRRERRPRRSEEAGRNGGGRGGGRSGAGRGGESRGGGRGGGSRSSPAGSVATATGTEDSTAEVGATASGPGRGAGAGEADGGGAPGQARRRRKRGGRGRSGRPGTQERPDGGREAASSDGGAGMDVALERQGEVAEDFLEGLVEAFGLEAEITIEKLDDETLELSLNGDDVNILIGARGATLQAIQDLARTVVQRQTGASHGRILVDVLGYRKKRRAALERFALQIADEVKASGDRRVLEPMGAADRKVVHDIINTIDGVQTTSEGEEPRRRVIILPGGSGAGGGDTGGPAEAD